MKKINYRLIVLLIILLVVAIRFFTFKPPITQQENFTKLSIENSNDNQNSKSVTKRTLQSDRNFYANSEFAEFFRDVPCKDTYLLYNYFSELKDNQRIRKMTLKSFAIELAKNGFFDRALEIADIIEDQGVYLKIVEELLKAGQLDRALEIAESMTPIFGFHNPAESDFVKAKEYIAVYLAKNGEFDRALEIAKSVGNSILNKISNFMDKKGLNLFAKYKNSFSSSLYEQIISEMVNQGMFDDALNVANSMSYDEFTWGPKVESLLYISNALDESGNNQINREIIDSALIILDSQPVDETFLTLKRLSGIFYEQTKLITVIDFYNKIASFYWRMGEPESAKKIYDYILKSIDSLDKENNRFNCFNNAAKGLAMIGEHEWSARIFEDSMKFPDSIQDKDSKDFYLRILGSDLIESGNYSLGMDIADKNFTNSMKAKYSYLCAEKLLNMGEDEKAFEYIRNAVNYAQKSDRNDGSPRFYSCYDPSSVLWDFAKELAKLKKDVLADQYFNEAIQTYKEFNACDDISDQLKRGMVADFLKSGRLGRALEIAKTITSEYLQDESFKDLAGVYLKQGNIDKSLHYLESMNDLKEKFYKYKSIAVIIIEKKNFEAFEKLFPNLLNCADEYTDEIERNEYFFIICQLLLALPCSEQQKYIPQFVNAYES